MISGDWSSDVCSSDLGSRTCPPATTVAPARIASHAGGAPVVAGGQVRLPCADPTATLRELVAELGDDLAGVEIVRPSLETVYLALTGRRTVEPVAVAAP